MRRAIPLVFAFLALLTPATAADEVDVTFSLHPAKAAPGQSVELRADVQIKEGWYVYASNEENGVSLVAKAPKGLSAKGALGETTPTIKDVPYVGKLKIHSKTLRLTRTFVVDEGAAGKLSIPATVGWQACDKEVCLFPATKTATLTLEVSGSPAPTPAETPEEPSDPLSEDPLAENPLDDPFADPLGDPLGLGGGTQKQKNVTFSSKLSHLRVRPGARVELSFEVKIAKSWHIYGLKTPMGSPTQIAIKGGAKAVGAPTESKPHDEEIKDFGKVTSHYDTATFTQVVEAPSEEGEHVLTGELTWQACDPQTCVDGKGAFAISFEVAKDAPETGVAEPEPEPALPEASADAPAPDAAKPPAETSSVLGLIGASFLLGLAMLLMPCTYPMIPITISVFSKGQQASRAATIGRAAVYAGGIVLSFLVVGGVVQVAVGGSGQAAINAFATNAWVNLVIGVVFLYFAFSFFGYYELGLPAPLQRLMQLGTAKTAGDGTVPLWSLFLMGLFFVLTSYTCGAPVVLGLFVTAAGDPNPMSVLLATFVFATTVAAPFFVLALVPNAMRLMPKSGAWFSVFKVVLGLLELGFAIKFFRGVDLQWGASDILSRPVTLGLWLALCVIGAVYLVGRLPFKFPHDPPLRPVSGPRVFFALLLLSLGGYFGYGLTGAPLSSRVEAFILAKEEKVEGDPEDVIRFTKDGLTYGVSLERLERGQKEVGSEGRMFLMFTGHNCVNCVQMEKGILPREAVNALLKKVPRVALFTDKGETEAQHRKLMVDKYNSSGAIPAFFVIDGTGAIRSTQIGNCSEEDFVAFLKKGGLE